MRPPGSLPPGLLIDLHTGCLTLCSRIYPLARAALYEDLDLDSERLLRFTKCLRDSSSEGLLSHSRKLEFNGLRDGDVDKDKRHRSRFARVKAGTMETLLARLARGGATRGAGRPDDDAHALAWLLARTRLQSLTVNVGYCPRVDIETISATARVECLTSLRIVVFRLYLVDWLPILYRAADNLVSLCVQRIVGDPSHNIDNLPCPTWKSLKDLSISYDNLSTLVTPISSPSVRFFASAPVLRTLTLPTFREPLDGAVLETLGRQLHRLVVVTRETNPWDGPHPYLRPHWDLRVRGKLLGDVCPRLSSFYNKWMQVAEIPFLNLLPESLVDISFSICVLEMLDWLAERLEDPAYLPNLKSLLVWQWSPQPSLETVTAFRSLCKTRSMLCLCPTPRG